MYSRKNIHVLVNSLCILLYGFSVTAVVTKKSNVFITAFCVGNFGTHVYREQTLVLPENSLSGI